MTRYLLSGVALIALSACQVSVTPGQSGQPNATPQQAATPAAPAAPAAPAQPAAPAAPAGGAAPVRGQAQHAAASGQTIDTTNQDFTIHNNTAQAIIRLYVSTVSTNSWEEDVLGTGILAAGQATTVRFARAETECQWDIKVDLADGTSSELRNVNLCQTTDVNVN